MILASNSPPAGVSLCCSGCWWGDIAAHTMRDESQCGQMTQRTRWIVFLSGMQTGRQNNSTAPI